MDSETRAAFIGAVVGWVGAVIPLFWIGHNEKKKQRELVNSWRIGLSVELDHILTVLDEAKRELSESHSFTKRLNTDLLEATRLKWCEYDQDIKFLAGLSDVYRNVVHTNGMLERLEKVATDAADGKHGGYADYFRASQTVNLGSVDATRASVSALKKIVADKLVG